MDQGQDPRTPRLPQARIGCRLDRAVPSPLVRPAQALGGDEIQVLASSNVRQRADESVEQPAEDEAQIPVASEALGVEVGERGVGEAVLVEVADGERLG